MKNLLKGTLLATTLFMGSSAMAQQAISLPRPNMNAKSLTVTEALSTRHSVRQFDTTPLTLQQLSMYDPMFSVEIYPNTENRLL